MNKQVLLVPTLAPPNPNDVNIYSFSEKKWLNLMYAEYLKDDENVEEFDLLLPPISVLEDNPIPLQQDLKHIYEPRRRRNKKQTLVDNEKNKLAPNADVFQNKAPNSMFEDNPEEIINYISQSSFLDYQPKSKLSDCNFKANEKLACNEIKDNSEAINKINTDVCQNKQVKLAANKAKINNIKRKKKKNCTDISDTTNELISRTKNINLNKKHKNKFIKQGVCREEFSVYASESPSLKTAKEILETPLIIDETPEIALNVLNKPKTVETQFLNHTNNWLLSDKFTTNKINYKSTNQKKALENPLLDVTVLPLISVLENISIPLQQDLEHIYEPKRRKNNKQTLVDNEENRLTPKDVFKNKAPNSMFEDNSEEVINYISQSSFFDFQPKSKHSDCNFKASEKLACNEIIENSEAMNKMKTNDYQIKQIKLKNNASKATSLKINSIKRKKTLKKKKLCTDLNDTTNELISRTKNINLNKKHKSKFIKKSISEKEFYVYALESPSLKTGKETLEIPLIIDETPEIASKLLNKPETVETLNHNWLLSDELITDDIDYSTMNQKEASENPLLDATETKIETAQINDTPKKTNSCFPINNFNRNVYYSTTNQQETATEMLEINQLTEKTAPKLFYKPQATESPLSKYSKDWCLSDNFINDVFQYSPIYQQKGNAIKLNKTSVVTTESNEHGTATRNKILNSSKKIKIEDYFTDRKPLKRIKSQEILTIPKKMKQTIIEITNESLGYSTEFGFTAKTKLSKFCTSYKSQVSEVDQNYDIFELNTETCPEIKKKLIDGHPIELIFDVVFREGYCQLSKQSKETTEGSPIGLFIGTFWNVDLKCYYYLQNDSVEDNCIVIREFIEFILSSKISCRKICYDTKILYKYLIRYLHISNFYKANVWDLSVGCWLLSPQKPPSSFGGLIGFLKLPNSVKIMSSDGALHACNLMNTVSKAMEMIKEMLQVKQMWMLFEKIENRLPAILAIMEMRGIKVDHGKLETIGSMLKEKLIICETRAHNEAGRVFQVNSTVQLRTILYDELKLDEVVRAKIKQTHAMKKKSTCKATLLQLKGFHPLPGLVLQYRRLQKLKSAHIDAVLKCITPHLDIKTVWDQTMSATGRLISKGPNLQAIPKKDVFVDEDTTECICLRELFVARHNYTLLTIDFQQLELRVLAYLVQSIDLISAINMPGDLYENITKIVLGGSEVKNHQRERTKKIVYSILYCEGPFRLSEILNVDVEEAKCIIASFSMKLPSLAKFAPGLIAKCRNDGFLTTISGRRRNFPNIRSSNYGLRAQSERLALCFVLQGCVADICKSAMLHTDRTLKENGELRSHLILQIHEELVWEIHDEDLKRATGLIVNVLSNTGTFCKYLSSINIPIPFHVAYGKTWGKLKQN